MNVIPSVCATPPVSAGRARLPAPILKLGHALLPLLQRGQSIGAAELRPFTRDTFGDSDAEGIRTWKDAFEVTDTAQVLLLRKFGTAIAARANAPRAVFAMSTKVTRRIELIGLIDRVRDWQKSIGLYSEMFSWEQRLFVPRSNEGPAVLSQLIERNRLIDVMSRT
ncbi:hypothetical protein [Ensifer aridi]|uniref:hypothetical protein n=1 Tax=Ensifer aridi TaxID=1708715 RepID=UPI001FCDB7FD|nr:hypothetical protein [Ensifer aridi]